MELKSKALTTLSSATKSSFIETLWCASVVLDNFWCHTCGKVFPGESELNYHYTTCIVRNGKCICGDKNVILWILRAPCIYAPDFGIFFNYFLARCHFNSLCLWRAGHKGFPDTKWATNKKFCSKRFRRLGHFQFVRIENALDGETSSNKTSCLSLTSCLGNPCVPPFIISKCEWALKSLSPSWNPYAEFKFRLYIYIYIFFFF